MTVEELLIERYKILAEDTSGNLEIGKILVYDDECNCFWNGGEPYTKEKMDKLPHLFKKLEWWEERKDNDWPEYYKYSGNHGVFKTSFIPQGGIVMLDFSPKEAVPVKLEYCLPATEAEYKNYLLTKDTVK